MNAIQRNAIMMAEIVTVLLDSIMMQLKHNVYNVGNTVSNAILNDAFNAYQEFSIYKMESVNVI
jgi:hypothetical protein